MTGSRDELKKKIAACRRNAVGARQYPAALRLEIVRYLDREVRGGGHFTALCRELGVQAMVVRRWRKEEREGGFAEVRVVTEGATPSVGRRAAERPELEESPVMVPGPVVLTSPSGWRIEGLSVEAVAQLLPRLG